MYTQTTVTLTGLNIDLSSGHQYWIGLQNNLDDSSAYSFYIGTENAADTTAFQINNLHEYFTPGIKATAFTIQGAAYGPGVPELPTWTLMLLGFGGLGVAAYRRGVAASPRLSEE